MDVNLDQMIEVLTAAKNGEMIEQQLQGADSGWVGQYAWDFECYDYRITPKKELSLVEELRNSRIDPRVFTEWQHEIMLRAADRIEELEASTVTLHAWCAKCNELVEAQRRIKQLEKSEPIIAFTTDELLAEIKRRTE